ncbi:protein-(glutamine-N5) methyltransferase [Peptoniphilus sp. ING2-D1G]|nr:protein-(glutamine-N5) methyltransferase [Peptoniphilus sp. ING2-D1G]
MDINKALKEGLNYLEHSDYTNSFYETRLILSTILKKDMSFILAHGDKIISEEDSNKYFQILRRRKSGEPLSYIFGETEFYGHKFYVDNDVLIPRKDTEISVEVLEVIIKNNNIKNLLEIGVGTGIVSISIGMKFKSLLVDSVDISNNAIKNTEKNIEYHNLNNVKVFKSDLFDKVTQRYDIIYSNPPYIKSGVLNTLQKELNFEPKIALDGGFDGLFFYKRIISECDEFLNKNGYLVFEIGYDQKKDLYNLLKNYNKLCIKDLSDNDRVIVASKGELNVPKFGNI